MSLPTAAVAPISTTDAIPFEQRLYMRSPFGTLATSVLIFALLFGSFVTAAAFSDTEVIARSARGIGLTQIAWSAMVLSLLSTAALGMQRNMRVREAADSAAYARIFRGGLPTADQVSSIAIRNVHLTRATISGVAIGLILSVVIQLAEIREGHTTAILPMAWYVLATTLLSVLFSRGVEQTRAGSRQFARVLEAELKIDLLRTDTLAVLGRSAARLALIWFVVSAIACLFFVSGDLNWLTIALIVSCAAMGIGIFASIMNRIHHQIVAAKRVELEHVRRQIDAMRAVMSENDHAATRLHGLLAYEKRIADAQEWPFDQSTLVRVGASALILTVPWFGQAIAAYVVDHLSR